MASERSRARLAPSWEVVHAREEKRMRNAIAEGRVATKALLCDINSAAHGMTCAWRALRSSPLGRTSDALIIYTPVTIKIQSKAIYPQSLTLTPTGTLMHNICTTRLTDTHPTLARPSPEFVPRSCRRALS
jgi:hypothetical protein